MPETYESIVFLREEDAAEVLAVMETQGEKAALAQLMGYYEPGEGTIIGTKGEPWKTGDGLYREGNFVMYYDAKAPYIALVHRIEIKAFHH